MMEAKADPKPDPKAKIQKINEALKKLAADNPSTSELDTIIKEGKSLKADKDLPD